MLTEHRERQSLLSLPYSERQMIVVTEDEVVDALYQAELEVAAQADHSSGAVQLGIEVSNVALRILFGPSATTLAELAVEAIKAWKRAQERGIPIRQVGKSEANELTFPPGHPRDTVVYIGHPAMPDVYYTIAEFHRVTFEHKFSEAIRLLMYLGANQLRVEHIRGWSREFSSRLSVQIAQTSAALSAHIDTAGKSHVQLLYEAELGGTQEPKLPESLVWYSHEPTWQVIAEGRLQFELHQFSLNVVYEDDYGVNAGLRASASKAGFDLGGHFEDHEATMWRISGRFCANDQK